MPRSSGESRQGSKGAKSGTEHSPTRRFAAVQHATAASRTITFIMVGREKRRFVEDAPKFKLKILERGQCVTPTLFAF